MNDFTNTTRSITIRKNKFWGTRSVFCLLLIGLFFPSAPASAATFHLDAVNGNDSNPGTSEAPWKTFSRSQSKLASGDTVIVKDGKYGKYREASVDRTGWVTYRAADGHHPEISNITVDNQGRTYDTYLSFEGFTLRPETGMRAAIEIRNSAHTKFLKLNVIGQGAKNTSYGFYGWQDTRDVLIDKCTFSGGENTGRFDGFSHGIYAVGTTVTNLTFSNNEIRQFSGYGIRVNCNDSVIKNNNIHLFGGDGIAIGGGEGPLLIEGNQVHDLYLYKPTLSETPTTTTWSADGLTMTNPSAKWGVNEPLKWEDTVEIWVNSGTNVVTGDRNVSVGTVISPTEIRLKKSIKSAPGGVTPSNVDYYFISVTHADLVQVFAGSSLSNLTMRGNQFYDCEGQILWINPSMAGQPNNIGGSNFLFENNLCWNSYADGRAEYFGVANFSQIDGLTIRNNIVIGRLNIGGSKNVAMHGNTVGYISITETTALSSNDYNIFCRGNMASHSPGANTKFLHPGYSWDKWNSTAFTGIFADYKNGNFKHASANSFGVGRADPRNSPSTDIRGNPRGANPDAGCYEYSSVEEPQLNISGVPSSGDGSAATPDEGGCNYDDGTSAALTTDITGAARETRDNSITDRSQYNYDYKTSVSIKRKAKNPFKGGRKKW